MEGLQELTNALSDVDNPFPSPHPNTASTSPNTHAKFKVRVLAVTDPLASNMQIVTGSREPGHSGICDHMGRRSNYEPQ